MADAQGIPSGDAPAVELSPVSASGTDSSESLAPAAVALSATVALAVLASANLTLFKLGPQVLYDAVALPRFVLTVVGLLAASVLWGWQVWRSPVPKVRWHATAALLGLVALLSVAAATVGVDPLTSVLGQSERLEGVVTWVSYALAFWLGLQLLAEKRSLRAAALSLVAATGVLAVYGLLQFAGLDWADHLLDAGAFDLRRAFATLRNPNFFAGLLVLALPCAVALAWRERGWVRVEAAGAAVACAGALVATFTRGAWIAAAVEVALVFAVPSLRQRLRGSRTALLAGIVAVVLMVAAVGMARPGETSLPTRLSPAALTSGSASERLFTWQTAASAIGDRPLLGWGPDAFLAAFRLHRLPGYAAVFGTEATVSNAHSWPMQTAVTLGLPAALLFVGALVWAMVIALRSSRAEEDADPLRAACAIACIGFGVHMLFNVAVPGVTLPFFLLLGAGVAPVARLRAFPRWAAATASATAAALLAVAVVGGASLLRADAAYLSARHAFRGGDMQQAARLSALASKANPLQVKYARGEAEALAQIHYRYAEGLAATPSLAASWFDSDAAFARVLADHPRDYAALAWRAAVAAHAARTAARTDAASIARESARAAASLDAQGSAVSALAGGETDEAAVTSASNVLGLP